MLGWTNVSFINHSKHIKHILLNSRKPILGGLFFSNHENMKESELQIRNNDDINIISNIIYDK